MLTLTEPVRGAGGAQKVVLEILRETLEGLSLRAAHAVRDRQPCV